MKGEEFELLSGGTNFKREQRRFASFISELTLAAG
jgi:hypothetical protein